MPLSSRFRSRRALVALVLLGAVLVGAVVVATGDDGDGDGDLGLDEDALLAMPYERFEGGTATLGDEAGTPVVLNFFGSWCAPCVREMPAFEEVHQELAGEVTFIGLAVQNERSAAERLIEQTGVTYAIGDDPLAEIVDAFGVIGFPTTVIIDADGTIVERHTGELSADELRAKLAEVGA